MKILVACEYSGRVRDAFRRYGHDAISCDFLPTEVEGPHYQGNFWDIVLTGGFDMGIFFPDCTYVCGSGLHWNKRVPGRQAKTDAAVEEFKRILALPLKKKVIENPVGCLSRVRKPTQIIQPWWFYDDASKKTCLWIDGLPPLRRYGPGFPPRMVNGKPRWGNQTDSGQNNLPPDDDRWKERSRTYPGLADEMGLQWGGVFA